MRNPSSWQAYWLIRKNRYLKKRAIRKQLFLISFDKTTTFYSLIVGAYVFASIFIFNDFLGQFHDHFLFIEQQMEERFWLILTIVPIRFVFRSFQNPGIMITSSEYRLTMLPHSIKKVTLYVAIEQSLKQLLYYTIVSAVIIMATPIDAKLVMLYFSLFWLIELFMMIPQWKLFQLRFWIKLSIFLTLILADALGVYFYQTKLVSMIIFLLMLVANILLYKKFFIDVHWGRVTEVNDYLIWNMRLISRATQTSFKRERKYNSFLNRASKKKPFVYLDAPIHRRLWLQHIRENIKYVVNIIGALIFAIVVMAFVHDFVVLVGIAISIHIYTSLAASVYVSRFYSGIVRVLPWSVGSYRKSMGYWALLGFVPLLISISIVAITQFSWWSISFIPLVVCLFIANFNVKMDNAMASLDKKIAALSIKDVLAFISLFIILLCEYEPSISLVWIGFSLYGLIRMFRKKRLGQKNLIQS